ncbi:short-chain dehydrogenase [Actinomadura rubrobrunea]|uniref:Short-chain dehydrogenase n=1 Tax=Actinomadura rubrobrunea TaxID=115335 RepID=A0A9W6PSW9_9ACTN|nr:SDR family oxidoreductase [Actinomadura rubrobrunea]GLW63944.1 short-chain dehydrogenase [Actinomadura rubrobrunea]
MDLGLRGRRTLVTGGTRGVGRAVALAAARAGGRVVACYHRDETAAKSLQAELDGIGGGHLVVRADVTTEAGAEHLAARCRDALGGLDALVNNLGVDASAGLAELEHPEWRRVLDANLTSMYLVTRAALALLGDGGSIVNIGSSLAGRGAPDRAHYAASKAGVLGLTSSLSKELGPRGIRVNTVLPGFVDKPDEEKDGGGPPPQVRRRLAGMTALGRLARPDDVAGVVLFLAGDLSRAVTGASIPVDCGV